MGVGRSSASKLNPYDVNILAQAVNETNKTLTISATHGYFAFLPQDEYQEEELLDYDYLFTTEPWLDMNFSTPNRDSLLYYTVIDLNNEEVPSVPHVLISTMDLEVDDLDVLERAYDISGQSDLFEENYTWAIECDDGGVIDTDCEQCPTCDASSAGDGGHGTADGPDAGLISLVESWSEHIALTMLANNYSPSNVLPGTVTLPRFSSWPDRLEFIHNESLNHVPIEIFNDLIDFANGNENTIDENELFLGGDATIFLVNDQVDGYNNNFLFQNLTPEVESIEQLRTRILNNPLGNTSQDITDLFNDY